MRLDWRQRDLSLRSSYLRFLCVSFLPHHLRCFQILRLNQASIVFDASSDAKPYRQQFQEDHCLDTKAQQQGEDDGVARK